MMTDAVTGELILEHLKRIQMDVSDLKQTGKQIREEIGFLRHDITGIKAEMAHFHTRFATVEARLDRVYNRLDLHQPEH